MSSIRVLVVDDSVVIRKILSDTLNQQDGIEVVGVAANGLIALSKIPQVNPDIVTLDIEMPEMDGLTTLKELRKIYPKLPVIMFSTLTLRGAEATLDALSFGASDYVTKPANVGSVGEAMERVASELVPKVRQLTRPLFAKAAPGTGKQAPAQKSSSSSTVPKTNKTDIVTIGVSTGGPNALAVVLPSIPADFPVPIVIVQHMPPVFTKSLAFRLDAQSQIDIVEGTAGQRLRPGTATIAPGGFHMTLHRDALGATLQLNEEPPENSCRPAADVLFRSVVKAYQGDVLGVVLTGMGQDGLRGAEDICDAGGTVIVQDEDTSVVWGMPGFVRNAGLAAATLPLPQIASEIIRRTAKTPRPERLTRA